MKTKKFNIKQFKPCEDAIKWYAKQPDFETAWKKCERGDWMLWLAHKLGVNKRKMVLTAGYCAKTVEHLMKDQRSIDAVNAAIDYGEGKITDDELRVFANAAYAAYAAYCDAAYCAADAADAAAYAATSTAHAAYCAADAAHAATSTAHATNLKETADICRKYLTESVMGKVQETK